MTNGLLLSNRIDDFRSTLLTEYEIINDEELGFGKTTVTVISAQNKSWQNNLSLIAAIIPEGQNITTLYFHYDEENIDNDTAINTAYEIIRSYRYEPRLKSLRTRKHGIKFYCFDGSFRWTEDYKQGYMLYGKIDGSDRVMGIWETNASEINSLPEKQDDFSIEPHDAVFYLNNQRTKARGAGYSNANGFALLYYLIPFEKKKYCFSISIPVESLKEAPEELYARKSMQNLFLKNLLFH